MNRNQNQNKAFTLVELIVVITILAILATIAFISLNGYASNSRDSKRKSDIASMRKVLELSYLKNNHYPEPDNATNITYS
jgi:prepilin-type N-terminal cleavage/methylation domain-containing protein